MKQFNQGSLVKIKPTYPNYAQRFEGVWKVESVFQARLWIQKGDFWVSLNSKHVEFHFNTYVNEIETLD